jgi:hypothetical protein
MTKTGLSQTEGTATKFWRALEDFKIGDHVVMWNAFPWHPYDLTKGPRSNRTPNRSELAVGGEVLCAVLSHFEGVAILPVGREAESSLASLGIRALDRVYHPSRSRYEPQFREGLRERAAAVFEDELTKTMNELVTKQGLADAVQQPTEAIHGTQAEEILSLKQRVASLEEKVAELRASRSRMPSRRS